MNNNLKGAAMFAAGCAALIAALVVAAYHDQAVAAQETTAPAITRIEAPQETAAPVSPVRIPKEEEAAETVVIETVRASAPAICTEWDEIPLDADVKHHIVTMCAERDIDPAIIFAQIWRESNYRADVIGDRGNSFGLMQIQPRWHSERMDRLGVTDLLDPVQNVTVGIDYLDELIERYGDIAAALTAYNRGSYTGTVTQYAISVLEEAERLVEA